MPDGFDVMVRNPAVHDAVMPGWNGVFSARALAKMYGAIANGGVIDGKRFLKESTIDQMSTIQTRDRDYVLAVRPNWTLGYHPPIIAARRQPRNAIGTTESAVQARMRTCPADSRSVSPPTGWVVL